MGRTLSGPWNEGQINAFLNEKAYPLRLACVDEDGFPRVVSVWFGYDGEKLHCVSHASSLLVRLLQRSERVGFEIAPNEPPYMGVRGQGIASLTPDTDAVMLTKMLQRFLGGTDSTLARWLLSRADDEMLITIDPVRLFSWDYRERMSS
ncbi:MAG: nitroimidazol reductase NimA-like FMN-containing flavoprotein [Bacteroidia bacterium]|jgi:nitroimidazol reductase NimA-like FMN-containing flavoprotein (pyridoxamine 5'-phosphate oxidase superfamily)